MADFEELRDQLLWHRQEREQARVEAMLAAESVRATEQALATARRFADDHDEQVGALEGQLREASSSAQEAAAHLADLDGRGARLVEGLAAFTNPVEGISRFSD